MLYKETLTLKQLELDDECTLYLEFNEHHSSDPSQICLRYCLVTDNDTGAKVNLERVGVRSEEFSAFARGDETVSELRVRLLRQHDRDDCAETRFRLTNWAGESGDILGEFTEETEAVSIKSLVDKSVIKAGDMMLIGTK